MPPMDRIVIIGAGALARAALDILEEMGWRAHVHGYVDPGSDSNLKGQHLDGAPVVGGLDRLSLLRKSGITHAVVAIEDGKQRATISQLVIRQGIALVSARHPATTISRRAKIGDGSIIFPGCIIGIGATTGLSCVVGNGASVDGDVVIEHYVSVGSGCVVASGATVGEGGTLGAGVTVAPGVKIGPWSVIPAGARVLEDVKSGGAALRADAKEAVAAGPSSTPHPSNHRPSSRPARRRTPRSR